MLIVKNLSKGFGKGKNYRELYRDLSFQVDPGKSLSIIGASGCGKSTLLACILGMVRPNSGQILVMGQDITKMNRCKIAEFRRNNLGMVFQHSELIEQMSALENTMLPALINLDRKNRNNRKNKHSEFQVIRKRAEKLLQDFALADVNTLAGDLSGGERQRVALSRVLMNQPSVILADEPTGSLDTDLRDQTAKLLFESARTISAALVVVTHDPKIANMADQILQLDQR